MTRLSFWVPPLKMIVNKKKKIKKNKKMSKIIRVFLLRRNKNRVPYEIQSDREPSGCAFTWVRPLFHLHTTHRQADSNLWIYKNTFYGRVSLRQVPNRTTPPSFLHNLLVVRPMRSASGAEGRASHNASLSSPHYSLLAQWVRKPMLTKIFTKTFLFKG